MLARFKSIMAHVLGRIKPNRACLHLLAPTRLVCVLVCVGGRAKTPSSASALWVAQEACESLQVSATGYRLENSNGAQPNGPVNLTLFPRCSVASMAPRKKSVDTPAKRV